ncbi:type I restriction enzyme HsdR N-terminal domain-containing protein [Chryseobacterium sp. Ch-15]|uniref:Type I restriction enzyme HsdR N-terminal domain-containing protein n=1 Tax=Chryseobacterium muglaense TaxID=2893752 RepID=A0A9Q3USY7_9FLAO|nr:type I restriction enzyme HsdR N-terminal domain-containing protein [Chryseobacterium muglaense]MBD3903874.1 type I restriction enzyme HsdR N-terminal domain-containing protein [Chryseobacterium muglaense]MCC9032941.1 type I restriction enzyme HsdR N-terminal domain-containing protein [Chryseobacterium muglaense]MCM2553522.1 type I restriction enzyme HsdR N-terminal domain-containing protein [Chryseobacterium muglaense]
MELPKLNFQETFDFKFKKDKDKFFIYDLVRKTYLLLTPEEWVRQHWIHFYLTVKSYSTSALITEKKIVLNGLTKRIDLLITEKAQPKILIECKAPQIKLTEKTFEQTARYNSVIGASEIILTNGLQHINAFYQDGRYQFYKPQ